MTESQDEYLKDLERRAKTSDVKHVDDEVEDIEAFLKAQEGDDYVPPPKEQKVKAAPEVLVAVTTPVKDKTTPKVKDPLPPKEPKTVEPKLVQPKAEANLAKKDPRAQRRKDTSVAKRVERPRSKGMRVFLFLLKAALILFPIILTTWLIGAWMGSWVTTGWLLLLIALAVAIVPGILLFAAVRKGRAPYYIIGTSLVLSIVLLAAFPKITSESLVRHGHWPVTMITEPAGITSDNYGVSASNYVTHKMADALQQDVGATQPLKLGSAEPLYGPQLINGVNPGTVNPGTAPVGNPAVVPVPPAATP